MKNNQERRRGLVVITGDLLGGRKEQVCVVWFVFNGLMEENLNIDKSH